MAMKKDSHKPSMASHGQCLRCGRKFWWTGNRDDRNIPACGGCRRVPTDADFRTHKHAQK